ncbi:DUF4239 domain-containing protein [Actinomadura fulvescens]|uniref:DUF4239 domain-containing protein n=2 Tax=Actinomadura fulvescens TaxID=46160 RepID=A0ABN3QUJ4_9ACTN
MLLQAVVIAIVAALAAIAVFGGLGRLRPEGWRQKEDEAAGTLVTDVIKTMFAFVFAFVVVTGMQHYNDARENTTKEASELMQVYWAAHGMPDPEHREIQGLVREYTSAVVNEEWRAMSDRRMSPRATATLDRLRDRLQQIEPRGDKMARMHDSALTSARNVSEARRLRALHAEQGLPGFLWIGLLVGAVLMICAPLLAGVQVTVRSVAMVGLLGAFVALAMFLIWNLNYPFGGGISVAPDAFRLITTRFSQVS